MRGLIHSLKCIAGVLLVVGCRGGEPAAEKPLSLKGEKFQVALAKDSPLYFAVRQRLNEWEFRTESKVEIVDPDAEEAAIWIGDGGQLAQRKQIPPIPKETLDRPLVDHVAYPAIYRLRFAQRNGEAIAFPLTTDMVLLWYRKDLFEDEAVSERFQKSVGRPLSVPATWSEYLEVAKFFFEDDAVRYGCVEPASDQDVVRTYFVHCAAYAKGRNWSSFAIDNQTGQSRLDAPPFLRGLREMQEAFRYSPVAEGKWCTEAEARETFRTGQAAMMLGRSSPLIEDEAGDAAKLDVGVAVLPGSYELFEPSRQDWQKLDEINRCVHFATTGTYVTLNANPQSAASNLLLQFLADKQESVYLVYAARQGLLPARIELLREPDRFAGYGLSTDATSNLFRIVRESLDAANWVTDLRASRSNELREILAGSLKEVLTDEASPKDAIQKAHGAWTDWLESNKQQFLSEYRESLGLPKLN